MAETMTRIDPTKLRVWLDAHGLVYKDVSYNLGQNDSFISQVLASGAISDRKLDLFCRLYQVNKAQFLPGTAQSHSDEQGPYSVGLVVRPDKVRLTIRHEGQDILSAWSYIKGPDEADLVQAISYAAHMCYKLAEQNKLAKDKED